MGDRVELRIVEVADDVQKVVHAVVENMVKEKDDLCDGGCRQDGDLDVEVDVQDVVEVLEEDNVEQDAVENSDRLRGVIVDVEDVEDDVEVVDVAQHEVDEVEVRDETVVG